MHKEYVLEKQTKTKKQIPCQGFQEKLFLFKGVTQLLDDIFVSLIAVAQQRINLDCPSESRTENLSYGRQAS
jgi:hypothetical protein